MKKRDKILDELQELSKNDIKKILEECIKIHAELSREEGYHDGYEEAMAGEDL